VIVLANMMNLWKLDAFIQDLVKGVIITVAVTWALRERRRRSRSALGVRGG
jgi:ribose/xylose/arabinose/galactoside ABC-type transport system permease subunit